MKTLVAAAALFAGACAAPVPAMAPKAQLDEPTAADAVARVAQDMGDAMVAGDLRKLDEIYADDFAMVGNSGAVFTKKDILTDHDKLVSFELGPTNVQAFDHVAVSQGSVQEKRLRDGKDTSGQFAWMDLLEKRAGKWVVLRSAGARVTPPDSPKVQAADPTVVQEIKDLEQHVGDAMVAFDIDKIDQAYGDDWATVGHTGEVFTKKSLLDDFRTRKHVLKSFQLGPMNVQVFGDVAMAQASVSETRAQDGQDASGQYVFMDLLKKREGKWVIVRTLGARVN